MDRERKPTQKAVKHLGLSVHEQLINIYQLDNERRRGCGALFVVSHLKRLSVLCSSIRLLLPVRSSSCSVEGRESGNRISVWSLQLTSTSYTHRKTNIERKHPILLEDIHLQFKKYYNLKWCPEISHHLDVCNWHFVVQHNFLHYKL